MIAEAAEQDEARARDALESICRDYWPPVYSFLRKSGRNRPDAQDLTQGFFETLVAKDLLQVANQEKGRLRSFLLGALKRFLSRQAERASTTKRGGGISFLPLEVQTAEEEFERELRSEETPESLYERAWAAHVVARARHALEAEYGEKGKSELYQELQKFLEWNPASASQEGSAERLGMTLANLRTNIYRLRGRLRELLEDEIAETVLDAGQVEEELEHLVQILQHN